MKCFLLHSAMCNVNFWLCKMLMLWFWDFKTMGYTIASSGTVAHWHVYVKPCSQPLMAIVYRLLGKSMQIDVSVGFFIICKGLWCMRFPHAFLFNSVF